MPGSVPRQKIPNWIGGLVAGVILEGGVGGLGEYFRQARIGPGTQ